MLHRGIVKEQSNIVNTLLRAQDLSVILLSGWLAHILYLGEWKLRAGYPSIIGIALLLSLWLFPQFSLYRTWRGTSFIDEVRHITLAWTAVILGIFAFVFFTKSGAAFSRGWIGVWIMVAWGLLLVMRGGMRVALRLLRRHGMNQRHIVIVGTGPGGTALAERLRQYPGTGLNITGFFRADNGNPGSVVEENDILGGVAELRDYVERTKIDQVWVALSLKEEDVLQRVLHELRHSTADIRYVPDLFGYRMLNHAVSEVAGLPVIDLSVTPMNGIGRVTKAIEDYILALVILLLISPLMLLIAAAVKLTSPGPVFYRQERVGWNGKVFTMFKFRSMPVDVEKDGVLWGGAGKSKQATALGALLRRTSLDELPQFINVLAGEMSIVGPRPERPMFVDKFKDEIPGYMKKHLVKAGITGWAQINGWRGDTDIAKRVEYDLHYIENWSIWFDLKIIFLTLFRGFVNAA